MELDTPYALPEDLADLVTAEWPRFSDAEMEARHAAIDALMAKADVKYLLVYGFFWNGPAIPWLTHWPTSAEAALVVAPGEEKTLYIQFHNHVPQGTVGATHCRVDWGGSDTMATVIDDFRNRGAGAATAARGLTARRECATGCAASTCAATIAATAASAGMPPARPARSRRRRTSRGRRGIARGGTPRGGRGCATAASPSSRADLPRRRCAAS